MLWRATCGPQAANCPPLLYVYKYFSVQEVNILLDLLYKQLSEGLKLNVFALHYYEFKIKLLHSYLQKYGTTVRQNCRNFQVLLDCIVMNGIIFHIIT